MSIPQPTVTRRAGRVRGIPGTTKNYLERVEEQRRHLAAIVDEVRRINPCAACGDTEDIQLDFHHLDPAQKRANISDLLTRGWVTRERLVAELALCTVLCVRCHRRQQRGVLHLAAPLQPLRLA